VNWFAAIFWFVGFMFAVLLVLFNMLLTIVMDNYTEVKGQTENPITVWHQAAETYQEIQERKGFEDLWYLICEFEDDDAPAHPDSKVHAKSLRRAFPDMSKANAEYLVRNTVQWVRAQQSEPSLSISQALRVIARMNAVAIRQERKLRALVEHYDAAARKEEVEEALRLQKDEAAQRQAREGRRNPDGSLQGGPLSSSLIHEGYDIAALPAVEACLKEYQVVDAQTTDLFRQMQDYSIRRDVWMEERMSQVEVRCEEVRSAVERLTEALTRLDPSHLAETPKRVEQRLESIAHAMDYVRGGGKEVLEKGRTGRRGAAAVGKKEPAAFEASVGPPDEAEAVQALRNEMKKMSMKLGKVVEDNEGRADFEKLLRKVDANLKIVGKALGLEDAPPEEGLPSPQRRMTRAGILNTANGDPGEESLEQVWGASELPGVPEED